MTQPTLKLLLTGCNGQVGSAIRRLSSGHRDITVFAFDSTSLDITDIEALRAAVARLHPDMTVNAAAYTAVDRAETDSAKAFSVNADGARNLAQVCAEAGIPLVHISTDYVFDGSKTGAYLETDPVAPLGVYGRSKLAGEEAVRLAGGRHLVLRTSWVFGLEGHNFPKTILRLAKERPSLGIVSDQRGCPTFADDLAAAILSLGEAYRAAGELAWGLYHYAGSKPCSWYEFASCLLEKARAYGHIQQVPEIRPLTTLEYPTPAARPTNSHLDCSSFCKAFPAIPLSDWDRGLDILLKHIK